MEEGMKLVITTVVLFFIAFAVLTIFSDNLLDFLDHSTETDDQSSEKFLRESCRLAHGDYYYIVKEDGDVTCLPSDCSPQTTTIITHCNPPADGTTTCCCKCK